MGFFDKKIEGKTAQEWLKLAYSTDDYYLQIKYCDNALSAKKELGQAWMKKGFALGCINDYKESMKCCIEYLKIIEKDTNQFDVSGYITAYILLGANAHNLHAYDGAIKFYDDAIDMCEKIMNDQKMLNIFNLKMDDIKSQCSSLWGHKMDVYIASSQWNEVEKCLDMRIKYNPKDTEAIKLKAGTLKSSKKYTDALQIYNKILEVDPIHLESLSSKAECFKELKQYNEAMSTKFPEL